ncbi:trypsin-like cysteine/serine peptidase domain-containing protein [Podospora didyma]|uniref:Trypsin-like cysteine/serine peptidase domain-containing protein n=1 Tax=Podospora didyma TaxID=330526 RepID=A0AAE0NYS9_9PEZI|nr:trypsin-like cysteine/serine peptidase domain-containing protein [Podospora didyma]
MSSPRRTRQQRKQLLASALAVSVSIEPEIAAPSPLEPLAPPSQGIVFLPDRPPAALTKLRRADHKLLLRKQELLQKYEIATPRDFQKNSSRTVSVTLVFAQEEAGTAVCIRPDGLLLTCSHCVAETAAELDRDKTHWLLFASGQIVSAKCIAWDPQRDLALLQITAAAVSHLQKPPRDIIDLTLDDDNDHERVKPQLQQQAPDFKFPAVEIADRPPPVNTKLVCIGHPGSEDLEAGGPRVKTNYDVLHLSTGAYRGTAEGHDDLQDNAEIGALQHDCWTYWGHSGAPLLERKSGRLVGLHSSWDDETGMRRGIPLEAIVEFLDTNGVF